LLYGHPHIVLFAAETNKFELFNCLPTEWTTSTIKTPFQQTFQMEKMPAVCLHFIKIIQTNRTSLLQPAVFLTKVFPVILDRQDDLHRLSI